MMSNDVCTLIGHWHWDGGNTYCKTELVVVTNIVSNFLVNMQEGLNEIKQQHFVDIWIEKMMSALRKDPPVGWLVVRWDFPQKFELYRKREVSKDFYSRKWTGNDFDQKWLGAISDEENGILWS